MRNKDIRRALVFLFGVGLAGYARAAGTTSPDILGPNAYSAIPQKRITNPVSPAIESEIIELFSKPDCERIRTLLLPEQISQLKPLLQAVVAYCEPPDRNAEEIFGFAEARDPSNEAIYVLHARYRWKHAPESSIVLWRKVLLLSRSVRTKRLAEQYIEGTAETEGKISIGTGWQYFAIFQAAYSHESNPLASSLSETSALSSNAVNNQLIVGASRETALGSLGTDYALTNNRYFEAHEADFLEHDVDLPLSMRVGTNEDIVLRPFGLLNTLGNQAYQAAAGLGVMGVAFRSTYKQSVQGSIFRDRLFQGSYQPQQGIHYRFEFNWEFYPPDRFFRFMTYIEHVATDTYADLSIPGASIPYSHTDLGMQLIGEQNFRRFTLGLAPRILVREDSDASYYPSSDPASTDHVTTRRQDLTFAVQANVTIPLASYLQFFAWYEFYRNYSNIGFTDYTDRRTLNQTVGLSLRAFFASSF